MLYSIGKDSSVMLRLAQKAFYPAPIPFPLLHVDTGYKFREMLEFRDRTPPNSASSCSSGAMKKRSPTEPIRSPGNAALLRTTEDQALLDGLARPWLRRGLRRRTPR